jgi:hypothetical protein
VNESDICGDTEQAFRVYETLRRQLGCSAFETGVVCNILRADWNRAMWSYMRRGMDQDRAKAAAARFVLEHLLNENERMLQIRRHEIERPSNPMQ